MCVDDQDGAEPPDDRYEWVELVESAEAQLEFGVRNERAHFKRRIPLPRMG